MSIKSTMTLEQLTLEVLAERILTESDSKKLVDWAIKVMELGYDSEDLYVLAGLDFDTTEEREKYFLKSMESLGLQTEKSKDELLESYAVSIAGKAISKDVSIDYAFNQLMKVVSASGYESRYLAFYEIREDLDYLTYDNSVLYQ